MKPHWPQTPLRQLDELEAYDAMRAFLDAYWRRGEETSDDLAVLLGSIDRGVRSDGPPLDIAQWSDWQQAVGSILKG